MSETQMSLFEARRAQKSAGMVVTRPVDAWHFVASDHSLRTPVGTETRARVGVTLRHDGPLVVCESGLHASVNSLDALQYAPGPVVCRVRMGGEVVRGGDKLVASERTVLWMADATDTLRLFAADCAERALLRSRKAGREPDARSWAAIEAIRGFVAGTVTVAQRDAAWDAARDAAQAAAWDAAWDAAQAAAWAAAQAAAQAAARAAAWDAARDAAWTAAWDAARDAAWTAAWDAERRWQARELTRRLMTLRPGRGT